MQICTFKYNGVFLCGRQGAAEASLSGWAWIWGKGGSETPRRIAMSFFLFFFFFLISHSHWLLSTSMLYSLPITLLTMKLTHLTLGLPWESCDQRESWKIVTLYLLSWFRICFDWHAGLVRFDLAMNWDGQDLGETWDFFLASDLTRDLQILNWDLLAYLFEVYTFLLTSVQSFYYP